MCMRGSAGYGVQQAERQEHKHESSGGRSWLSPWGAEGTYRTPVAEPAASTPELPLTVRSALLLQHAHQGCLWRNCRRYVPYSCCSTDTRASSDGTADGTYRIPAAASHRIMPAFGGTLLLHFVNYLLTTAYCCKH